MFIWSDQDQALGPDGAKLTAQFVTGPYRFEVLKGIDHWIPDKAPERLSALLLDAFGAAA
jgi:pimeloyl-ACP methyl ester carboxylesterase